MAMLIDRCYNPFRDFEDIDRSFFGDNSLAEFKTDIRDIGDAYVMECDLPGFRNYYRLVSSCLGSVVGHPAKSWRLSGFCKAG